jgi:hypothetical protein
MVGTAATDYMSEQQGAVADFLPDIFGIVLHHCRPEFPDLFAKFAESRGAVYSFPIFSFMPRFDLKF